MYLAIVWQIKYVLLGQLAAAATAATLLSSPRHRSQSIDLWLDWYQPTNQPTVNGAQRGRARVSLMAKGQSVVDPGRCGGGSTLDRARGPVADNVSN